MKNFAFLFFVTVVNVLYFSLIQTNYMLYLLGKGGGEL